jgi:hypothetical protein
MCVNPQAARIDSASDDATVPSWRTDSTSTWLSFGSSASRADEAGNAILEHRHRAVGPPKPDRRLRWAQALKRYCQEVMSL